MRIRFYATLRNAAETKELDLPVTAPTPLDTILRAVSESKPKLQTEFWDEHGNLRDITKVFVNGRQMEYLPNRMETLVQDTDELDVFPPVGGG